MKWHPVSFLAYDRSIFVNLNRNLPLMQYSKCNYSIPFSVLDQISFDMIYQTSVLLETNEVKQCNILCIQSYLIEFDILIFLIFISTCVLYKLLPAVILASLFVFCTRMCCAGRKFLMCNICIYRW